MYPEINQTGIKQTYYGNFYNQNILDYSTENELLLDQRSS